MKIPLSSPDITEIEKKRVLEVLNTPTLSIGPRLEEFESKFARYVGSKYAIAVNSGTSGLHLCIRALGIKSGDLVVTTPFSFVASANCIIFEGAIPVFCDINEKTFNLDMIDLCNRIEGLASKNKTPRAILPVHIFGRPCDIVGIKEIARKYGLKVIEDACEAVGAECLVDHAIYPEVISAPAKDVSQENEEGGNKTKRKKKVWKKVGTFSDCGVFGFYPNKQITTGEGGIIVTDDEYINKMCKSMRNQGRSDNGRWLQHVRLGYNYRMSEMNCALGIAQIDRINEILNKRDRVVDLYRVRLKENQDLIIPDSEEDKKISWFVYVVRLIDSYSRKDRDFILRRLRQEGIGCSNYFSPIHLQPFYREMFGFKEGDFPVTERISERTIALPFYNNLREEQIDYVCKHLNKIIMNL